MWKVKCAPGLISLSLYTCVFIWKDLSHIVIFIEIQNMENFYVSWFWHHAILLSWLLKVQYLWSFFKAESLHDVKWSVFLQSLLRCREWVLTCKCHEDNSLAHIQVLSHLLHIVFAVQMTVQDCTCWRHQMETFSTLLALCVGFHLQRPVMQSFDVFFDLPLKQTFE